MSHVPLKGSANVQKMAGHMDLTQSPWVRRSPLHLQHSAIDVKPKDVYSPPALPQ